MLLITEHAIFKYDPHFLTSTYLWGADSGRHLFLFILTHFSNCPLMILKHSFLMPFTQVLRKKMTMSVTVECTLYMYWFLLYLLYLPCMISTYLGRRIFSLEPAHLHLQPAKINSCNLELVTEMSHTLTKCILLSQNYMYQIHAKNYW